MVFLWHLQPYAFSALFNHLTHWGQVTQICVSKLTIFSSNNDLSPGRHQATMWTNAGILLIRTSRINFIEILSETHTFSIKKMYLKMSSAWWGHICPGLNKLTTSPIHIQNQYWTTFVLNPGSDRSNLLNTEPTMFFTFKTLEWFT